MFRKKWNKLAGPEKVMIILLFMCFTFLILFTIMQWFATHTNFLPDYLAWWAIRDLYLSKTITLFILACVLVGTVMNAFVFEDNKFFLEHKKLILLGDLSLLMFVIWYLHW